MVCDSLCNGSWSDDGRANYSRLATVGVIAVGLVTVGIVTVGLMAVGLG